MNRAEKQRQRDANVAAAFEDSRADTADMIEALGGTIPDALADQVAADRAARDARRAGQ